MTREEANKILYVYRAALLVNESHKEAFDMAIKALEQGDIVEKIRDKIEQFANAHCSGDDINIYDVFQIIDNYKTESEE